MATKTVLLTTGTTWTVPSDWTDAGSTIRAIGAGGAGAINYDGVTYYDTDPAGGGGGAFASVSAIGLTANSTVYISIGAGVQPSEGTTGTLGGDTWLNKAANAAPSLATNGVLAKGGGGSGTIPGGVGGQAASCVGSVKYSGGNGSYSTTFGGGGGSAASDKGAGFTSSSYQLGGSNACTGGGAGTGGVSEDYTGGNLPASLAGGPGYDGVNGAGAAVKSGTGNPGTVGGGGSSGAGSGAGGTGGSGTEYNYDVKDGVTTSGTCGAGGAGGAAGHLYGPSKWSLVTGGAGGLYGGGAGAPTWSDVQAGNPNPAPQSKGPYNFSGQGALIITYTTSGGGGGSTPKGNAFLIF